MTFDHSDQHELFVLYLPCYKTGKMIGKKQLTVQRYNSELSLADWNTIIFDYSIEITFPIQLDVKDIVLSITIRKDCQFGIYLNTAPKLIRQKNSSKYGILCEKLEKDPSLKQSLYCKNERTSLYFRRQSLS